MPAEVSTGPQRLALRAVQIGAIATVLAASIIRDFELDRFLVPKELALNLTAVVAGLLAFGAMRRIASTRTDVLLLIYLGLSALAAVFATNRWLGVRALAVSASSIALFWIARALRQAGLERPLLNALALAVVIAAITSLAQAYGLRLDLFATSRSPGGTLGNRNFVAHAAAFGLPVVMLAILRAQRHFTMWLAGVAIVFGALVLTRSRAAWLASAAMLLVFFATILMSSARRDAGVWRRLATIVIVACAGVAAALLIPNTLRWRSDNPYLDSVTGVANYQEGSGRGRLVQYERSLRMALFHPLFGVGPGNWPVRYPEYAARRDPSLDGSEPGTTFNPWPSSDWIAFISERGPAAAVVLALVFLGIAGAGFRRLRTALTVDDALLASTLLSTLIAAVLAGLFDAVLLLALPAMIVWTTIGACFPPPPPATERRQAAALLIVLFLALIGAVRSTAQIAAMQIYSVSDDRASLERAAAIDPGNYRLQLRLGRAGRRQSRCEHARAAHALFPSAEAARGLSRSCGM